MIIITVISILVVHTTAQFQPAPADDQHQYLRSEIFYEAAPLHYVNIGSKLAGDYKFAYDTGKGPMGQSFREETRLADGTVKGSYGVIDETGHKRIVHYSSGKGNLLPQAAQKSTITPFPTTQERSNLLMQQNFDTFSQQQPIFKPANYLQSRATRPVNIEPIRLTPQKEFILKKQKPVEKIKKSVTPVYKSTVPTSRVNVIQPVYKSSTSFPTEQATVSTTSLPTMSEAQPGSITALAEMYKSLKRVPKTTSIPKKLPTIPNKIYQATGNSYESTTEEYYYDSAPAFVDIERLSYSIGTDKSSSV